MRWGNSFMGIHSPTSSESPFRSFMINTTLNIYGWHLLLLKICREGLWTRPPLDPLAELTKTVYSASADRLPGAHRPRNSGGRGSSVSRGPWALLSESAICIFPKHPKCPQPAYASWTCFICEKQVLYKLMNQEYKKCFHHKYFGCFILEQDKLAKHKRFTKMVVGAQWWRGLGKQWRCGQILHWHSFTHLSIPCPL